MSSAHGAGDEMRPTATPGASDKSGAWSGRPRCPVLSGSRDRPARVTSRPGRRAAPRSGRGATNQTAAPSAFRSSLGSAEHGRDGLAGLRLGPAAPGLRRVVGTWRASATSQLSSSGAVARVSVRTASRSSGASRPHPAAEGDTAECRASQGRPTARRRRKERSAARLGPFGQGEGELEHRLEEPPLPGGLIARQRGWVRQVRVALAQLGEEADQFGQPDVGDEILDGVLAGKALAAGVHQELVGERSPPLRTPGPAVRRPPPASPSAGTPLPGRVLPMPASPSRTTTRTWPPAPPGRLP